MEAMSESCVGEQSLTVTEQQQQAPADHGLTLRLTRPRGERRVVWTSDTIDNEHLGRRSSKCCCVYQKPRDFGESSSDSEPDEGAGSCGNAHCPHGHAHGHPDPAHSHAHPDPTHGPAHGHPDPAHGHPDPAHGHPHSLPADDASESGGRPAAAAVSADDDGGAAGGAGHAHGQQ